MFVVHVTNYSHENINILMMIFIFSTKGSQVQLCQLWQAVIQFQLREENVTYIFQCALLCTKKRQAGTRLS